jgi:hypothetical protein
VRHHPSRQKKKPRPSWIARGLRTKGGDRRVCDYHNQGLDPKRQRIRRDWSRLRRRVLDPPSGESSTNKRAGPLRGSHEAGPKIRPHLDAVRLSPGDASYSRPLLGKVGRWILHKVRLGLLIAEAIALALVLGIHRTIGLDLLVRLSDSTSVPSCKWSVLSNSKSSFGLLVTTTEARNCSRRHGGSGLKTYQ